MSPRKFLRRVTLAALWALSVGVASQAAELQPVASSHSERLALVTFTDRGLQRAPTGGPGDTYARTADYDSTAWGRRIASELGKRHKLSTVSQWPVLTLGVHCVVYSIDDERSLQAVSEELRKEGVVDGVYPMHDFHTMAADPYKPLQSAIADMQLNEAHRFATGRDVTVAVVDTAIDLRHPDLRGQVSTHRDLVNDSSEERAGEVHGTAVGGIIAARAGNAAGIVGVAPAARLAALRACWASAPDALDASCNTLTLAKAIDTAIRLKVRVLNLSLTGPRDALLETLLANAMAKGMLVVGAMPVAGRADAAFPTAVPGVIRVGVAGQASESGAAIAPGTEVFTTLPHERYGYMSGSSIAAAHVTGVIALLLEVAPDLDAREVSALLTDNAAPVGSLTRTVNACTVLARAGHGVDCARASAVIGGAAAAAPLRVAASRS
ncbi:MAG: S8 family serine peptidase [Proteobacteria bacterium]|nr:S8 family serine peptidase [Pseudomonadota bacterium]